MDPDESWLEKWLLHECNEVYTYWSCALVEEERHVKRMRGWITIALLGEAGAKTSARAVAHPTPSRH